MFHVGENGRKTGIIEQGEKRNKAELKYQQSGSPKKPVSHTPKEGGEGREEDGEPCLPAPSQPVLWIYRKDIVMGDQIQRQGFLDISISFWAIQILERPDWSNRTLIGFVHTDAVHSVPDGPARFSARLLSALKREGGLGWIWSFILASGKYQNLHLALKWID